MQENIGATIFLKTFAVSSPLCFFFFFFSFPLLWPRFTCNPWENHKLKVSSLLIEQNSYHIESRVKFIYEASSFSNNATYIRMGVHQDPCIFEEESSLVPMSLCPVGTGSLMRRTYTLFTPASKEDRDSIYLSTPRSNLKSKETPSINSKGRKFCS